MATELRQTSIAKEDEARGSAPLPPTRPAFVLFEVCTRAAWQAVKAPTLRTQQQAWGVVGASVHMCMSWGGVCVGSYVPWYWLRMVELLCACLCVCWGGGGWWVGLYHGVSIEVRCVIGMYAPV